MWRIHRGAPGCTATNRGQVGCSRVQLAAGGCISCSEAAWCDQRKVRRRRKATFFFFGRRHLPFGWSPDLRLSRGPAGNRTTTGSLSATQECRNTNWATRTPRRRKATLRVCPLSNCAPAKFLVVQGSHQSFGGRGALQ